MRPSRGCDPGVQKGAIAQLGERVLCKHEVVGSIPSGSTSAEGCIKLSVCGGLYAAPSKTRFRLTAFLRASQKAAQPAASKLFFIVKRKYIRLLHVLSALSCAFGAEAGFNV